LAPAGEVLKQTRVKRSLQRLTLGPLGPPVLYGTAANDTSDKLGHGHTSEEAQPGVNINEQHQTTPTDLRAPTSILFKAMPSPIHSLPTRHRCKRRVHFLRETIVNCWHLATTYCSSMHTSVLNHLLAAAVPGSVFPSVGSPNARLLDYSTRFTHVPLCSLNTRPTRNHSVQTPRWWSSSPRTSSEHYALVRSRATVCAASCAAL
jgi:hypothetical protein